MCSIERLINRAINANIRQFSLVNEMRIHSKAPLSESEELKEHRVSSTNTEMNTSMRARHGKKHIPNTLKVSVGSLPDDCLQN